MWLDQTMSAMLSFFPEKFCTIIDYPILRELFTPFPCDISHYYEPVSLPTLKRTHEDTHSPSFSQISFLLIKKKIVSHIKAILFCLTGMRSHWLHFLDSLECQVLLSCMRVGLLFCFYYNRFHFVDIMISPVINQHVQGEHHLVPLHPLC